MNLTNILFVLKRIIYYLLNNIYFNCMYACMYIYACMSEMTKTLSSKYTNYHL